MTAAAQTKRERWLAARRKSLGGSDAAAALGVSPWQSPFSLYQEKIGAIPGPEESPAMKWGTALEPAIRAEVRDQLGPVVNPGKYALKRSPVFPHMHGTFDGVFSKPTPRVVDLFRQHGLDHDIDGPGVLEIKTTGAHGRGAWADGEWPIHYQCQCQHLLVVALANWGVVAVLIGGQDFRLVPFRVHEKFADALIEKEAAFWALVEARKPPPVDGEPSTSEALRKLHPTSTESVVHLGGDFERIDGELVALKAERTAANKRIAELENEVKNAIGGAAVGALPSGVCYHYREQQRAGFTVAPKAFRVLRRKEPKK